MRKLLDKHHYWVPLLLLILCLGAYGVYLNQLGFYWDDWMTIYMANKYEVASKIHNFADRPLFAWMDITLRSLLGLKPLYWHILFFILRWLTSWSMWGVVSKIWPKYKEQMAWTAILFTVYPTFFKQSLAVTYRSQYVAFLFFLLSIILMVQAYQNKKFFWPYTILGMAFTIGHLLTMEYFGGLELIRPIILFFVISSQIVDWKERIKRIFINWSPYLLMILVFIIRRFIYFPGNEDPNPFINPKGGGNFIQTFLDIVVVSLRDIWHVLVTSWSDIVQPEEIITLSRGDLLAWGIAAVVSLGVYFIMRNGNRGDLEGDKNIWNRQVIPFGIFSLFAGLLPVWLTGRNILEGFFADRFSIPAMFGASILIVALINLLISQKNYQRIILTFLLAVTVSAQIRETNDFRWDWVRQTRAYWQIYWRAPAIEPNTAIISDGALTSTTNRYNAAFAMNFLYPQVEGTELQTYWWFEIPYDGLHRYIPEMLEGMPLTGKYHDERFEGHSRDSILVITPELEDQCLWFLTPRDVNNNVILEDASMLSQIADLERIYAQPSSEDYPIEDIFGQEPKHSWCYYFQKASLARQFEDWDEIIRLWDEAEEGGYQTAYSYELIPFIEAFAYTGDWNQAAKISTEAYEMGLRKNLMVCASWRDMQEIFRGDEAFDNVYNEVAQALNCE
jgi:hypothetical protein